MCELLVWCLFNRILDEVFGFLIKYVDLGGVDRQIDHLIRVVMRNAECLMTMLTPPTLTVTRVSEPAGIEV